MGKELRQQYAILAKGAQERTRSGPVDVIDGDLQQVKKTGLMPTLKSSLQSKIGR
jgi:hypothetical protein